MTGKIQHQIYDETNVFVRRQIQRQLEAQLCAKVESGLQIQVWAEIPALIRDRVLDQVHTCTWCSTQNLNAVNFN